MIADSSKFYKLRKCIHHKKHSEERHLQKNGKYARTISKSSLFHKFQKKQIHLQ